MNLSLFTHWRAKHKNRGMPAGPPADSAPTRCSGSGPIARLRRSGGEVRACLAMPSHGVHVSGVFGFQVPSWKFLLIPKFATKGKGKAPEVADTPGSRGPNSCRQRTLKYTSMVTTNSQIEIMCMRQTTRLFTSSALTS